jgi:photosystem II stability/assembly factor-like uncharacterized protein
MQRRGQVIGLVLALYFVALAGTYYLVKTRPPAEPLYTYTEAGEDAVILPLAEDINWEYVPMRTATMKNSGRTGGEMGQMAYNLTISTQNPNLLAMAIDTAGIYVSEDGGINWELRRKGIISNGVQSVSFDPVDPDVMWAAGLESVPGTPREYPPDPDYYDSEADGIYRSTDGGATWELVLNTAYLRGNAQNIYFAFDPSSAGSQGCQTVFAITHSYGLIKTTDGGYNWESIGPEGIIGNAVIRDDDTGRIWLAADEGLWLSQNDGSTWEQVSVPATPVRALAVDPTNSAKVFVGLYYNGLYRTTDSGQTWTSMSTPLGSGIYWTCIAISPSNPNYLYADAIYVGWGTPVYSHDGGDTWYKMSDRESSFVNLVYWAEGLVVHPQKPKTAYHLAPLRRTTDGGKTWKLIGNGVGGFRRSTGTSIAFDPNDANRMIFFHLDHGAAITHDNGDTWEYIPAPRQSDIGARTQFSGALDPNPDGSTIFSAVGGWSRQRFASSANEGYDWTVSDPDDDSSTDTDYFPFFVWHPQDHNVIYVGRADDSLRSDNGGKSWSVLSQSIMAIYQGNGDIVYSTSLAGASNSQVKISYDRGETWENVGSTLPYVNSLAVDPTDPLRIYAGTTWGGVWVYDGASWSSRGESAGIEADWFGSLYIRCVAVDPTRPNVIYAGQNHSWRGMARGVFRSTDYGDTWSNISGNLGPDLNVWSIMVSPHDGTVWLGTDYGNWRWTPEADETTGTESETETNTTNNGLSGSAVVPVILYHLLLRTGS